MRIYSISNNNYNNMNISKANNSSKPVFKGKNFAKMLGEFRFESFDGFAEEKVFKGFRFLMENVSKEPNFQIVNNDKYKELAAADTVDVFFDLLKNWYLDRFSPNEVSIARDSEGLLINYTEDNDGKILKFMSKDKYVFIKTKEADIDVSDVFYVYGNSSDSSDSALFG